MMGNAKTKRPTSPDTPRKQPPPGGLIQHLEEDIKCSICLGPFVDPVSIDCGHNFCRSCLSYYWRGFLPHGYRCPECRYLCSRERIKSDTRLRNLVEKIGQLPAQEIQKELDMPASPPPSGEPLQLLGLDENGDLCLNEEVLSRCLEQGEVKNCCVCLISILGEQRRGKSFLLNFLLRRLRNLEPEGASWMGEEGEPLTGFEWRPGPGSMTKGVWIWSQPFWIHREEGKVAVFLMDTEGSQDLKRSKEISVKLSAFSMLLSSYLILNVSTMMNDSDLEYLDMFVYVADTVGRTCKLEPLQHLDVVVRDWCFPPVYGHEGGQTYLQNTIQELADMPGKHPRALAALRSSNTCCYLMPFPGKPLVMGTAGTIADMDADFRQCLREYVDGLARAAGNHIRKDQGGTALTGIQLAARIKSFSDTLKENQFDFASATEMAITLQVLEAFSEFIKEQDQLTFPMLACLKVTPKTMTQRLKEMQDKLETQYGPASESLKTKLKSRLQSNAKDFLDCYGRRFISHAIKAGLAVGVGAAGLAGGVIGAGVAGAIWAAEAIVLGAEATFAIGTVAGAGTCALVGGGVGAGVGRVKRKTLGSYALGSVKPTRARMRLEGRKTSKRKRRTCLTRRVSLLNRQPLKVGQEIILPAELQDHT